MCRTGFFGKNCENGNICETVSAVCFDLKLEMRESWRCLCPYQFSHPSSIVYVHISPVIHQVLFMPISVQSSSIVYVQISSIIGQVLYMSISVQSSINYCLYPDQSSHPSGIVYDHISSIILFGFVYVHSSVIHLILFVSISIQSSAKYFIVHIGSAIHLVL